MLRPNITRQEIIVPELELFHQIAIAYTNKQLATPVMLLEDKSLADIEELTGEDSEASHAFSQIEFMRERHGCGTKKSVIAIQEPQIPYVLNGTTIQTTEGGVAFANNRIKISSLNLVGTFNTKISKVRLNSALVANQYKDICNVIIDTTSGDTAASVLLKIANELTLQTKSSIKPLLANNSFTKYRGVVADKTALLALATPTNWDFSYVTSENDFFIYKNSKWLRTFIGTTTVPLNNTIYFVNANSGKTFNHENIALHFIDKNSNLIDVAQNITTYDSGITTADFKVGGIDVDTANRCVAGVGNLENISASESIIDLIFSRCSDIEKPLVYWNTSLKDYKDAIVPQIKNRYNQTNNSQIGKDLAGRWIFPVFESISGADAMDDIYFDSVGEIRDGWENNAQIELVRFSSFENENEHYDSLLGKPAYIKGQAHQGLGIINHLISHACYHIASIQDTFTNSSEVFSVEKAGNIQNISFNTRYIKDSFANTVRSNASLPFFEQLKSNKRNTNDYSPDIIDANADKYPFNFVEYVQQDGTDGFVISASRSLAKKDSALRKTGVQMIKLYFGWLASFNLKTIITNASQSDFQKLSIKESLLNQVRLLSGNLAVTSPSANQSPILQSDKSQLSEASLSIAPRVINGNNIYEVKTMIYPTGELNGVELTIYSTNK
jgi:hypothetical protein